ncbi:MAG: hypothetical protein ACT4OX_01865 [Actinomycetota bacterium]
MWADPRAKELFDEVRAQIFDGLPYVVDPDGHPLDIVIESADAWDHLKLMHDDMTTRVQELLARRGSAEWLWWLRRLRGQFDDFNTMVSTGPYVQAVAESLAAGFSRPSQRADHETFVFPFSAQVVYDLAWLREIAIVIYQLHSAMKRCAKGQRVHFIPSSVPRWEPDDDLDDAIEEYDGRTEREARNLMQALGVAAPPSTMPGGTLRVGGIVPTWHFVDVVPRPPFAKVDPLPATVEWIDLDAVAPLATQGVLTEEHVALIALLWASFHFMAADPERVTLRIAPARQWGYALLPTREALLPALDNVVEWMSREPGNALDGCWRPSTGTDVMQVLSATQPMVWPPLVGNPVHETETLTVVDIVGASRRMFSTLTRPSDGAAVNLWSGHFEDDVQAAIDRSPWRATDDCRGLIGRTIRRADGTALTDIDALGVSKGRLLLVSCKSIAFTVPALRGEHAITRNIVDKTHEAAADWADVVDELRREPELLGEMIPKDVDIQGCVAFPTVPFFTDPRWRKVAFEKVPYLTSINELIEALG